MRHRPLLVPLALLAASLLAVACSDKPGSDATSTPPVPAAATVQSTPAAASPSASSAAAPGAGSFDIHKALAHINMLAGAIGPRVAGSAGERQAVQYISDQLKSDGYSVEVRDFDFEGDPFRPAVLSFGDTKLQVLAMSGSSGGTVKGPGVFVGLGDSAGIASQDLTGKVAVADRGIIRYSEKMDNVAKAGAIGLVIINNEAGELLGNLTKNGVLPVVGLAQSEGPQARAAATSGAAITIQAPAAGATHSQNVLARSAPGDRCVVLVGGHHDTVPGAPGAHDNASGAAETLELARAFAADGLDKGLCFATFGAEESGLNGSKALVKELEAKGELPKFMVNLDTTGLGTKVDLIGAPELQREAATLAQSMGIDAEASQLGANFGSDHQSFATSGVSVLFFASNDVGKFHTAGDVASEIQPDFYDKGGELAYAFIKQLLRQVAPAGG